ncbi:MAG: hypothetical protein RL076_637 [Chloroflexota bacterium]|jgi:aminoglycoside phosphotransferase (APT) family kinase protein
MTTRMHAGEYDVTPAVVADLVATQFPQWQSLPLQRVASGGTDNTIYRLGDTLAVRLPRIDWAAPQVPIECRWLPYLAPQLPIAIPAPLAQGQPSAIYPWPWYIYPWLPGQALIQATDVDMPQFAHDLANWVRALHRIETRDGPRAGMANHGRGLPLTHENRDTRTRQHIAQCADFFDTDMMMRMWLDAIATPAWAGDPVWVHGDLNAGNVLVSAGRLSAVIDFGCMGIGDPAVDLLAAWDVRGDATYRQVFRQAIGYDADTWGRGRAWAFSVAVIALPYYRNTNPVITATAQQVITATMADWQTTR